ncbi:TPA: LPXTG cell wall anchor domain-containing protein [Streptococcus suis]|nr:LPXTG cell wall anchor domain-containing protein [Streptococcus suis]
MYAKKLVKWGVALTSTLVLGGVVGTEGGQLLGSPNVVYAEEMQSRVAVHAGYYFDGELVFAAFDLEEFWIGPGENKTIAVPVVDGYVYEGKYLLSNRNGERLLQGSPSARYEDTVGSSFVDVILIYAPAEVPVETPTEQPVEKPAEKPVETPTEQPVDQPVEKPVDQPVDQPTDQPAETPTEQPAEVPTEQLAEQPFDQPVEQLAEQVVDTPTDQPVEQLTDASSLTDQTAGKVQVVAATDKKMVDKSAPSTPAVKPEEGSQTTAKTLPKTGDSSSMLLVLGGVLSGLSGLGLAATSRKRD